MGAPTHTLSRPLIMTTGALIHEDKNAIARRCRPPQEWCILEWKTERDALLISDAGLDCTPRMDHRLEPVMDGERRQEPIDAASR
jgi:hypothetical protein